MNTVIRKNERSWEIDLVSKINEIVKTNDLKIKKAGGESTISTNSGKHLFPDVILYGNKEQSIILQGWELKMPDVPIEDETNIKNAQEKAIALNLNSFMVWNFTYAVLYVKESGQTFKKLKQWSETNFIHTRKDVETYRSQWEKLLEKVILELNGYFLEGTLKKASLGTIISESTVATLIKRNKEPVANQLKGTAFQNSSMAAYIDNWWKGIKTEYEHDETDKYKAYAKTIILNWANRIMFAHVIKERQNAALLINQLNYSTTPNDANQIFNKITAKSDFYNIFSGIKYNEILPKSTWQELIEFSTFFKNNGIDQLSQKALQNILENSITTNKRAMNGQYTTPPELARILARLSVKDWKETVLDCCCGTGTIPKEVIKMKKEAMSPKETIETVWACDKYKYPLQIANISMSNTDTINIANRIFQHNALTLKIGEKIAIIDPIAGKKVFISLPAFGTVVSNLPFVSFEIIDKEDENEIDQMELKTQLDGRSDLYCYIATKIADVIKPGGTLGIIVSNSWLGTKAGSALIQVLKQKYNITQVHISNKGRWFQNAEVVTTIIVLEKNNSIKHPVTFWLWEKSLNEISQNKEIENTLVNSALLGIELDQTIAKMSKYTIKQIDDIVNLNVCYNALFHHVDWLLDIKDKIIPIEKVFKVFRGSRRGWDPLFYPAKGEHKIEPIYLRKVLKNAKNTETLIASATEDAFCCKKSIETLKRLGHVGAIKWIQKFEDQTNGIGKPLPKVLKRKGMQWYELKDDEIAEVFTMMNPDQRFFFAKFETPSFINQRLIGLNHKEEYSDMELNHALLNSVLTMFYIEASGFGRGQGVLDISKEKIAKSYMLDPKQVSPADREKILTAFEKLKKRNILKVADELNDEARKTFEQEVFRSFGIESYYEKVKTSLLSMQKTRGEAKKRQK